MTHANTSRAGIIRSTSIIGAATIVTLVVALLRMKAFALLLGPAGVGVFGIMNVLFMSGSAVVGLNLSSSGVRQISGTEAGSAARSLVITAFWSLAWLCTLVGGIGFWVFLRFFYKEVTGSLDGLHVLPWVALAVALNTLHGAQLTMLQSAGLVSEIARTRVIGAVGSAAAGIAAAACWGLTGLSVAIVAVPAVSILCAWQYGRRLAPRPAGRPRLADVVREWRELILLGAGITAAAMIGMAGQLIVRSVIAERGGLDEAGLFQAAWTISSTNLSVILSAMAIDYFPRLSAVRDDRATIAALLNEQLHVSRILAAPVLALAVTAAPFAMTILYSHSFDGAAPLLQWQLVGDVAKLLNWAVGFVLIVRGHKIGYIMGELAFTAVLSTIIWLAYPAMGLTFTGIAYVLAQIAGAAIALMIAGGDDIRVSLENIGKGAALMLALALVTILFHFSLILGIGAGGIVIFVTARHAWIELSSHSDLVPPVLNRAIGKVSRWIGR